MSIRDEGIKDNSWEVDYERDRRDYESLLEA